LVGLCGLLWMLPLVFILANALQVMISMVRWRQGLPLWR
jgi:uncharacterized integral membrane protein